MDLTETLHAQLVPAAFHDELEASTVIRESQHALCNGLSVSARVHREDLVPDAPV